MSSRIEAYLAELDRRLARRVAEPRRSELIAELRSHLHLQVKDTGSESEALLALGPVELVAEDLIRSESGVDTRSVWRLAAAPLLWFLLYWLVPHVAPFLGLGIRTLGSLHDWTEPFSQAGLAVFAWAVWRSKRWLVIPMTTLLALFLFYSIAIQASRVNEPTEAEIIGQKVLAGNMESARRTGGSTGYLAPRMHDPKLRETYHFYGATYTVPAGPHLALVPSAEEAMQLWKEDREAFSRYDNRRSALLRRVVLKTVLLALNAAVFALVNGLVLLVDTRRRLKIRARNISPSGS